MLEVPWPELRSLREGPRQLAGAVGFVTTGPSQELLEVSSSLAYLLTASACWEEMKRHSGLNRLVAASSPDVDVTGVDKRSLPPLPGMVF